MARLLLVGLTALSCGLGPTLVQVVGWATMIPTEFSKTASVTKALENTFSGEHPCKFCQLAESLKAAESGSPEEEAPSSPAKSHKKQAPLFAQNTVSKRFFLSDRTLSLFAQSYLPPSEVNLDLDSPPPRDGVIFA